MSNFGRRRVRENRLYSPPALRSNNQPPEFNQLQRQVTPNRQQQEKQEQPESLVDSNSRRNAAITNLDRFMKHTIPIVTAQHFPKSMTKGWKDHERDQPYFVLGDLWESFREWSAYGAGVPLILNESDYVVQYYAPFLSAIQLYVDPSAPVMNVRRAGDGSDSDSSRANSSDGSYEAGAGGHEPENTVHSVAQSFNKFVLDEGETGNPKGIPVYEYFEHDLPFQRAPLADQASQDSVLELASKFPALRTYRSCDLTQLSWFSVAWYPIYRIPVGPSLQNVDSCFLTFHSLSTPLRGTDGDSSLIGGSRIREVRDGRMACCLALPTFGMAVYKFKSSDWIGGAVHGIEKVNSMMHSTDNWLRRLGVYHPDFMFFKNRPMLW
ncbi:Protein of unknown function DUF789 [Cynara cardunculus var. scolymus]|uniref:DUF789 domain-containing protein n=1 Tax=Cynara cardunculus var. scolymus TaxID=59895 RepID=A0A118JZC9_CYNCS|nr:Protein of unknown function DUF789 [Cynara cardunculus var. scolymus]